ncbi:unnamed protein product [Oreochromis niloticus]|nr:unnamed protein product [Mustela putorius furo]
MLVVVLLLMMMMKSDAGAADIIRVSANSSTSVVLPSGLQGDPRTRGYDVRWTQIPHLLLNWNRSTCSHGRCSMLPDGSLEFSRLQTQDSGSYTLEVFDKTGSRLQTKDFLLQVTDHSSSHVVSSVSVCVVLLVLLLFFIVVFILRKRRVQRKMTTGQKEEKEENIYVVMKGCQGNKNNEEEKEKKLEKEEEPLYVPCSPTVSSQHEDSVYV